MIIKIIQIDDGGASEYDSVEEWAEGGRNCSAESKKKMEWLISIMPSGTVTTFGGGWVLKNVEEV